MKRWVVGLDVGTSSVKCVAAPLDGGAPVASAAEYGWQAPQSGWAEQDPETWWRAGSGALRELTTRYPELHDGVAAVAVCGQGAAAVLVDKQCRPTRPAILWLDTRAAAEAREMEASCGDEIALRSGKRPAAYNVEPKLRWIQEHEPTVFGRTEQVLSATGYVTYRFSGHPVMNRSDAGILLSYDLRERGWSAELQRRMRVPEEWFGALADADETIGEVSKAAAAETGIAAGTPVLAGGEDTSAAALAAGVDSPERAILSLGTAGTIYCACEGVVTHPRLLAFPHVVPRLTLIGGSTVCGGSGLGWMAKLLGGDGGGSDLATRTKEAGLLPAKSSRLVFLPYLAGELQPLNDGFARGVFCGADFSTTPAEMMAAVMQGTAFAFRHNLELTREVYGGPGELMACGKPAGNPPFMQTVADVTGLPVSVVEENSGAALGAALLAAGAVRGAETAELGQSWSPIAYRVRPREERRERLDSLFAIYKEIYIRLADLFPRLMTAETASCGKAV